MIRLSSLTLAAALIALPAFAEGPQEKALDKVISDTEVQQDTLAPLPPPPPATVVAPTPPSTSAIATPSNRFEGPDERRIDQGLQPDDKADPQAAEVRKLNGGQ